MARALSVSLENGDVSCLPIHLMSVVGIDSRGKRAAWLSGPLKSLQRRHSPSEDEPLAVPFVAEWPLSLGLDLFNSARFGREARGSGGGVSVDLFKAKSKAERRGGIGGGVSSSCFASLVDAPGRGGRVGLAGNSGLFSTLG